MLILRASWQRRDKGSYGEMMLCYAITNTLTEFPEIKRVQILIEGKKAITLSGHMDIEDPLTRNTTYCKKQRSGTGKSGAAFSNY